MPSTISKGKKLRAADRSKYFREWMFDRVITDTVEYIKLRLNMSNKVSKKKSTWGQVSTYIRHHRGKHLNIKYHQ